jgi:hypothetical protein
LEKERAKRIGAEEKLEVVETSLSEKDKKIRELEIRLGD